MCAALVKKPKRTFVEAWLSDNRYKDWICKVSFDDSLYYCNVCNKNFSCASAHVSRHAESSYHKKNISNLLRNDDGRLMEKTRRKYTFQQQWLQKEQFKLWLREVPYDRGLFYCVMCDKSIAGGLWHIRRHAECEIHLKKCEESKMGANKSNEDCRLESNESPLFDKRKKSAEIRYAALIATKNISHQTAKEILTFFQNVGKEPHVLQNMSMGRTKCKSIIANVLHPVETKRTVEILQNTKFSISIDETSNITNEKWVACFVRYVDSKTLDICSHLIKLIDIDARDSTEEKLFNAFKTEMLKLQIPLSNIVALTCDNTFIMTEKHLLFKTKLEQVCKNLLTFSCPCRSAALIAHAASANIPAFCEEFIKKISNYMNSNSKRSTIFHEFLECFQEKNQKIFKLYDTRWLSHYTCVKKLLESWETIKYFLHEIVISEKTKSENNLLCMMQNLEIKAYFLFLKYVLNFLNNFNAFFQAVETKIHLLQSKSAQLLSEICKNFLKEERLKKLPSDIEFSLEKNQKTLHEITLGSECEQYLEELMSEGHADIVAIIRNNCLQFYMTAADEIRKKLPIDDIFLSKLKVFTSFVALNDMNRETTFRDVLFIVRTLGDFDEDSLKMEWFNLPMHFTKQEKLSLSKLNFDNMWKEILNRQDSAKTDKYPNLKNVINAVRSLPHSNTDPERDFSILTDIKTKKRNKLSSSSVNATCVLKSAFKSERRTALTMEIDKQHLSLMSSDKLYSKSPEKIKNSFTLYASENDDVAGPSSVITLHNSNLS